MLQLSHLFRYIINSSLEVIIYINFTPEHTMRREFDSNPLFLY